MDHAEAGGEGSVPRGPAPPCVLGPGPLGGTALRSGVGQHLPGSSPVLGRLQLPTVLLLFVLLFHTFKKY